MKRKLDLGYSGTGQTESIAAASNTTINPWTNLPYSSRYYEILKKRQMLPVYEFKSELEMKIRNNQTIVVEGETGNYFVVEILFYSFWISILIISFQVLVKLLKFLSLSFLCWLCEEKRR